MGGKIAVWIMTLGLVLGGVVSCTKSVESRPNFIFKKSNLGPEVVALFRGKEIREKDLYQGIEQDLYEVELKRHRMKMAKLNNYILHTLLEEESKKAGLTEEQFVEQVIAKGVKVSQKEIDQFVKMQKIPADRMNDQMKQRVQNFLRERKKQTATRTWLAQKTAKDPVEVYLEEPQAPIFNVAIDDSPYLGGDSAKVVVVVFSDFQCPHCQEGAKRAKDLHNKYGNKVKVVFKNFPLSFHNYAKLASQAGLCANKQSSAFFWQLHDRMFQEQKKLDKDSLISYAKDLKLNVETFTTCLTSGEQLAKVEADMAQGRMLGIKSTPSFFVNGRLVKGVASMEYFSNMIDQELNK